MSCHELSDDEKRSDDEDQLSDESELSDEEDYESELDSPLPESEDEDKQTHSLSNSLGQLKLSSQTPNLPPTFSSSAAIPLSTQKQLSEVHQPLDGPTIPSYTLNIAATDQVSKLRCIPVPLHCHRRRIIINCTHSQPQLTTDQQESPQISSLLNPLQEEKL